MAEATRVEWLDKDQAAKILDIEPRSVLAMAKRGQVRSQKQRDDKTRQMVVKVHAGDVERVKYERDHHEETAGQPAKPEASQAMQATKGDTMQALFRAVLLGQQANSAPPAKLWMTLDEAADYTGLSRDLLLRMIHQGKMHALQDKPVRAEGETRAKAGTSWRVSRKDLDALQGENQQARAAGA